MAVQSTSNERWFADFYRGRRVCVTGGAGFIGSHLCDALVNHGAVVSVIDDLSNGMIENLPGGANDTRFKFVRGSILNDEALQDATRGAEIVFHQAALTSVPRSVEQPELYFNVNVTGTLRVLECARKLNVQRVIYAASSSAYGEQPQRLKVETMLPMPLSPYAAAKFAGETMLRTYCQCYGHSGVSLRYFNIFGERQRPDSPYAAVIPRWIDAYMNGRKPIVFGDGAQTRDFTHVSNAVHANLLAGACEQDLRGEVVNIACGRSFSLLELIQSLAKLLKVKAEYEHAPPRIGEVMHSHASIDAARDLLGYEPIVHFHDGLKRTVEAFARHSGESGNPEAYGAATGFPPGGARE